MIEFRTRLVGGLIEEWDDVVTCAIPLEEFFICEWFILAGFGEDVDDLAKALPIHYAVFAGEDEEKATVDEVGLDKENWGRVLFIAGRQTFEGREYSPVEHAEREVGFSEGVHGWHRSIVSEIFHNQSTCLVQGYDLEKPSVAFCYIFTDDLSS